MNTRSLVIILVVVALGAGAALMMRSQGGVNENAHKHEEPTVVADNTVPPGDNRAAPRIPAYQSPSEVRSLPPTLAGSQFVGKAREAYEVAKKIPETLAQLPCYCECDKAFGHKSLHTCFENDHASSCAVCVDEALLAYQLQKNQKLTPEQVRDKIIEKYSAAEHQH